MKKTLPLLVACALAQGCVGIGTNRTKTERLQDPQLAEQGCPRGLHPKGTTCPNHTHAWLESHWGEPAAITPAPGQDGGELWTYKFGLNWNGAILYVIIIPIPLEVPVGRERIQLLVRNGRVISGEQRYTHTAGTIVGYSLGPCGPSGFGVHSLP